MDKSNSRENQALIDLCLNCTLPDCVGQSGCRKYQMLKRAPEPEEPRITFVVQDADLEYERKMLLKCNEAINALSFLVRQESMNMVLPCETMKKCLRELAAARSNAYAHLVDWDLIAQSIAEVD